MTLCYIMGTAMKETLDNKQSNGGDTGQQVERVF